MTRIERLRRRVAQPSWLASAQGDPEFRALRPWEEAVVRGALRHRRQPVEVPEDPRLRSIAARLARRSLTLRRVLWSVCIGIAALLIAAIVHLAVAGSWTSLLQLPIWLMWTAWALADLRRLRRHVETLEGSVA